MTSQVHPDFKKLAIQFTKDTELHVCSIDLMVEIDKKRPTPLFIYVDVRP